MKQQYFGDARDYFKYELLTSLMRGLPRLGQLTCVWMLTPPTVRREGNRAFLPDPRLPELTEFFRSRLRNGSRDLGQMRTFFASCGFRYFPYGDAPPYFSMVSRQSYFRDIPDKALAGSLVFFDPDTGMEPRRLLDKHLGFGELADVFDRLDRDSVAVVYQHLRRVRSCWDLISGQVRTQLRANVAYIAQGDLSFLVVPRDGDLVPIVNVLAALAVHGRPGRKASRLVGRAEYIPTVVRRH